MLTCCVIFVIGAVLGVVVGGMAVALDYERKKK